VEVFIAFRLYLALHFLAYRFVVFATSLPFPNCALHFYLQPQWKCLLTLLVTQVSLRPRPSEQVIGSPMIWYVACWYYAF